jgi:hypothetical protein
MPALAQAEAGRLTDASLGKATFTPPTTPMMLGCFTTTGTASAAGTEVVGGSYARQNLTTALPANSTNGTITTTGAINFTNMPAATTTSVEVYDSNGSPRRAWFGALTASKTTALGDTLSFAVGAITLALG